MRCLLVAAAAALSIAAASSFAGGRAEAMPLPGAGALGTVNQDGLVENVRHVCRPVWNGFRWVESCYWVPGGPRYYGYRGYGYGGPRHYRPYRHWRRY